jgi:hypothetical protein
MRGRLRRAFRGALWFLRPACVASDEYQSPGEFGVRYVETGKVAEWPRFGCFQKL